MRAVLEYHCGGGGDGHGGEVVMNSRSSGTWETLAEVQEGGLEVRAVVLAGAAHRVARVAVAGAAAGARGEPAGGGTKKPFL